jgi:hypothetical protein
MKDRAAGSDPYAAGAGVMRGARMRDNTFWAAAAPVIAIADSALAGRGVRGRSS